MSRADVDDLDLLELIQDCGSLMLAAPCAPVIPEPRTAGSVRIGDDSVSLLEGYADYGG